MQVKAINNPMALAVGTNDGRVLIYTLGLLQVANIQVASTDQVILGVTISDDYSRINVYHSKSGNGPSSSSPECEQVAPPIELSVFNLNHLKDNSVQYLALSHIYSKIVTLIR